MPLVSSRVGRFWRCALVCALAVPAVRAEDEAGRPVFRDFRPMEYRGHPQVFSLAESPEGFIYLGNQEGVIEFDGSRWTHLPAPTSHVYRLAFTSDGKMWVGGNDEVGYYLPDSGGRRVYHSVRADLPASMQPFGPAAVVADGSRVYFTGLRGAILWENGRCTAWPNAAASGTSLHRVGGELLALMAGAGLFRLEPDGRRTLVSDAPAFRGSARAGSVPLADGRVLFVVSNGGAFVFDPRRGTVETLANSLHEIALGTRINGALRLSSGEIAIGTAAQGLVVLSPDLKRIRRFGRSTGLADNAVLSLALDRDGGLWVGFNSGLARLAISSPVTVFDGTNGPTPGTVDAWGRHAGHLYAGTYDGLYRLQPATADGVAARFVRINDQVTHVFGFASHGGRLLVAGQAGLYQLDEQDRAELVADFRANAPLGLVASPRVPGRYYFPSQSGVVIVEHDAAGWHVRADLRTLGDAHTAALDDEGSLWLGTYSRGFWRLPRVDTLADVTDAAPEHFLTGRGLPDKIVWTTATPGVGGPVFFTDKGQLRFDVRQGKFVPEDRFTLPGFATSLFTPTLVSGADTWGSVFRDSTIVAASALGRFRAEAAGKFTWESAPADALGEIGFSGAAVMWLDEAPDGPVLWARGYDNTIRYEIGRPAAPARVWPALIRSLQAEGRAVPLPRDGTALALRYSREPVVAELAAPRFDALDGLRYQTRLLGFTERWSEPTSEPRVRFTNLEGGPFTLEARALDPSGRVSETARLVFTVAPPWHRSPSAYVAYAIALLAAFTAFLRWRLAAARREQARLERIVQQRTGELAAARDEAEAASRAKSTFLAHMSHELRTPLNGIIGYAQVLLKDAAVAGRQRERVNIVHASGLHLLRMINEVLDFSKIEAGKIERHDAPFHFGQLLRELAIAHEAAAHARGLAFALETPSDLPSHVSGDAQKLRQILDNLLSNAVKFTPQGRVTLCVARDGADRWRFAVLDTGVGLGSEDRARLFQPFEQARSGRPAEPGTGLGLAITLRLVQLLGGELQLDSELGRGSQFSFVLALPGVAPPETAARPAPPLTGYAGPRRRILVVDDNAVNRSLLTDLLAPLGFTIAEFASAEEMLAAGPGELRADLAFLDVKLPGLDGLELARRLRARGDSRAMPIVFTSASVLTFNRAAAEAIGCPDFLPKPFAEPQLNELLLRLLKLDWQHGAALETAAAATGALPRALLEQLLALADSGDIAALRDALAEARRTHANDVTLGQVETAAASYQLEQVRSLLRTALA